MNKKLIHIISWTVVIAFLCVGMYFISAFWGNPISSALARSTAKEYLKENFQDSDYEISKTGYDPKSMGYYVKVTSPSSIDSHFTIYCDGLGRYSYDTSEQINNGGNTFSRLYQEYWDLVEKAMENCPLCISMSGGELRASGLYEIYDYTNEQGERKHYTITSDYGLDMSTLTLDGVYNAGELGRDYGRLYVYIDDPEVSLERAAELLLELKEYMDQQNVGFYAVEFNLRYPQDENGQRPDERIELIDFLYSGIYEEGLTDRIQENWNIAKEHYAIQNGEKVNEALVYLTEIKIPEE